MRMAKGEPFRHIEADDADEPTFSWQYLVERNGLSKYEGRFILAVAEEYDHVIKALGPDAVRAILDVKPRLVRRLTLGKRIRKWLRDANSDEFLRRAKDFPAEVAISADAADGVWRILHDEYRRFFDPVKSMEREKLDLYNELTDLLGEHERKERAEADEQRPAMEERSRVQREAQKALKERRKAALAALEGSLGRDASRAEVEELVVAYLEAARAR